MIIISFWGAIIGSILAIILIFYKVHPIYALILGAIVGGIAGGLSLQSTIAVMFTGSKDILPAVLRVLAAGVLAGVLMESGATITIAETIIRTIGTKRILLALALSTLVLTASGVFIYVSVITVAPIALTLGLRTTTSREALLLAMIGGAKSGNIISPNPNTIAVADVFKLELTSVMFAGLIPAIAGICATVIIAGMVRSKAGDAILHNEVSVDPIALPSFASAISGPVIAIILLALKPVLGLQIDPMVALPAGGIAGAVIMGKVKQINGYAKAGLDKTMGVAVLLLCTGCISGIIANSTLKVLIVGLLKSSGLPALLLAPFTGIMMSAATASTTSGAAVASTVFSSTLLALGVKAIAGAAMINVGATVMDHMPHGSFFHASGGSVATEMKKRLKLMPYETLIGLVMTVVSVLMFYFF